MKAHSKRRTNTVRLALAGAGVVGVVSATGATWAVTHHSNASHTSTAATSPSKGAAAAEHTTKGNKAPAATTTTAPPIPLTLTSVTPKAAAEDVALNAPITVTFSAPIAAGSPTPTITPPTPGSWRVSGSSMIFTPRAGWRPYSTVSVTVPAGVRGGTAGYAPTAQGATEQFVAAGGSTLRLQQLLAELGYLPVSFAPSGIPETEALASEPTQAADVDTFPVAGAFHWTYENTPSSLKALWSNTDPTVITRGAVMAFEADHNLDTDGAAGPAVWSMLLQSAATHAGASHPYNYLLVSKVQPENLQVWSKGAIVLQTLANTGVYGADTAEGTFPVFEHVASTTMTGTNPDGTKYKDYGVKYVAYFNGGDAVHEFWRPGYGYPQSNGCVELPSSSAATVWGYDPIGTLVTVA